MVSTKSTTLRKIILESRKTFWNPIAMPVNMIQTSEQVVFWPSRVWRPRAIGVKRSVICASCIWKMSELEPCWTYLRSGLVYDYWLVHDIEGLIMRLMLRLILFCVKFDRTRGNALLNGWETTGKALCMSSKAWEPCTAANLDATFIYLFDHLSLQMMLTIIAVRKVTCKRRDSTHGLSSTMSLSTFMEYLRLLCTALNDVIARNFLLPTMRSFIMRLSWWAGSGQSKIHPQRSHMRQRHFLTFPVVSETIIEKASVQSSSMI